MEKKYLLFCTLGNATWAKTCADGLVACATPTVREVVRSRRRFRQGQGGRRELEFIELAAHSSARVANLENYARVGNAHLLVGHHARLRLQRHLLTCASPGRGVADSLTDAHSHGRAAAELRARGVVADGQTGMRAVASGWSPPSMDTRNTRKFLVVSLLMELPPCEMLVRAEGAALSSAVIVSSTPQIVRRSLYDAGNVLRVYVNYDVTSAAAQAGLFVSLPPANNVGLSTRPRSSYFDFYNPLHQGWYFGVADKKIS
ncbi:hypothetical protein EVAR_86948_1 [Eumeta japonica]|uniref:Uncharacterized protein n=1 Tax=Eumeta variegata TaxID=151549 RepID=A0A4C1W986_EUMVA|nr:hypothetical protein EVAR_86948_1 [Eumeta japonica]